MKKLFLLILLIFSSCSPYLSQICNKENCSTGSIVESGRDQTIYLTVAHIFQGKEEKVLVYVPPTFYSASFVIEGYAILINRQEDFSFIMIDGFAGPPMKSCSPVIGEKVVIYTQDSSGPKRSIRSEYFGAVIKETEKHIYVQRELFPKGSGGVLWSVNNKCALGIGLLNVRALGEFKLSKFLKINYIRRRIDGLYRQNNQ
jgi:hypothetical protein